jgi:N-acetylneuraminic acid mutarotase
MPTPKGQAEIAMTSDGMVYVVGGAKAINAVSHEYEVAVDEGFVYDPAAGTWSAIADMQYGARAGAAVAGDDGLVYVFGGYNDSWGSMAYTQIYDPAADSWSLGTSMPFAEAFVTGATGYDGRMYVFGGSTLNGRVQIYNPVTDSWSAGAPMPSARFSGSAVAVPGSNAIYYLGGTNSFSSSSSVCMVYDAYYNSWDTIASLPSPRAAGAAAVGADGLIYFIGGGNTAYNTGGTLVGQVFYSDTFVYSRFNDTWMTAASIPYMARYGMSVASPEGKIWFFGGNNNTVIYNDVSTLEVMRVTVSLSSSTVVQGDSVLLYVNPQFAYLSVRYYYIGIYLETPTGFAYEMISTSTATDTPFVIEVPVPVSAEIGANTVVMSYMGLYTPEYASVSLPLTDLALAVQAVVPIEDLIAGLEAQLTDLQAALASDDANVTAISMQVAVMQAKLDGIISGMTALDAEQSAAMAALNATLADLQEQLDAFQEQINRVEDKADTGGTYGMVTMVLVIIIIVLVALMLVMGRRKMPAPPAP